MKIKAHNIPIMISDKRHDDLETPPTEQDLITLDCDIKDFNWDMGTSEESDETPLCEDESRHTEYGLSGKGTITFETWVKPQSKAFLSLRNSYLKKEKRYVKVTLKDIDGKVTETREVLATVESMPESVAVGGYLMAAVTMGTTGKTKFTPNETDGIGD